MKSSDLKILVKNGSLDLTSSGVILIDGSKSTILTILDDGLPMDIILNFKTDEATKDVPTRQSNPIKGQNAFEIIFTNFNSALGTYNKEPWLIGTSYNRKLYLLYIISAFAHSNIKRFEYSFYLGEVENNG